MNKEWNSVGTWAWSLSNLSLCMISYSTRDTGCCIIYASFIFISWTTCACSTIHIKTSNTIWKNNRYSVLGQIMRAPIPDTAHWRKNGSCACWSETISAPFHGFSCVFYPPIYGKTWRIWLLKSTLFYKTWRMHKTWRTHIYGKCMTTIQNFHFSPIHGGCLLKKTPYF